MENWWIWMSFWPSFNGMICRPWLFPIFSYIKHWLHWLRVKPAFVPSNEMFIRVYPFLYFLYGLRVQPLLKKKHDRHHTKQNGVVINVVIFLQSFGFSLRVFPSGFPFGFPSGSLQCPVTRIPLDIEQDPWFFGRDSSWKQCHVAERCWKYPPLRNVSRQEWVANTKKTTWIIQKIPEIQKDIAKSHEFPVDSANHPVIYYNHWTTVVPDGDPGEVNRWVRSYSSYGSGGGDGTCDRKPWEVSRIQHQTSMKTCENWRDDGQYNHFWEMNLLQWFGLKESLRETWLFLFNRYRHRNVRSFSLSHFLKEWRLILFYSDTVNQESFFGMCLNFWTLILDTNL